MPVLTQINLSHLYGRYFGFTAVLGADRVSLTLWRLC